MGDESSLKSIAEKIAGSVKGISQIEVVGLDMEEEKEGSFDEGVEKASNILGHLDALVHCYSYEGIYI